MNKLYLHLHTKLLIEIFLLLSKSDQYYKNNIILKKVLEYLTIFI